MKSIRAKKGWGIPSTQELWNYRELFWLLVIRDIKLKYKQTVIGIAWVVLQPLVTALLFSLLFGYFAKFDTGVPYLLFAFVGMLAWLLFSQVMQRASFSLLGDVKLISKVYFPRLLIPLASATAVLIDFFIALGVLFILLSCFGFALDWKALLALPLLFGELMLAIGFSALFAAWNVHYRDFLHIIPFFLQLWMYASPLFYPLTLIPEKWQSVFILNPLVGYIEGFRFAFLGIGDFPGKLIGIAFAISVFVFLFGMIVFEKLERSFADVI